MLSAGALAYGYRDRIKGFVGHDQPQQVKALGETTWNAMVALRPIDDQRRVGANILLVLLETCRADKLGSYGFERDTTPALDELARDPDAATFLNHYVPASRTEASVASMFTGLFPSDHGVVTGVLESTDSASKGRYRTQVLSPEAVTIAEVLGDAGYYYRNTATIEWPNGLNGEPMIINGFLYRAVVFKVGRNPDIAGRLVRLLAEEGWPAHWLTIAGDRRMPPMRKLIDQPFWLDPRDPHRMRAAIQILTRPHLMNMDVRDHEWRSGPIWDELVWAKAVHRVVADGISPEQAVDEAIPRVKQILSE